MSDTMTFNELCASKSIKNTRLLQAENVEYFY